MFLFATRQRTRPAAGKPRRTSRAARRPSAARPRLEALETREVLSTLWNVTNTLDDGSPGSLRAEIAAAGNGDTVNLSALGGQTIMLTSGELVLKKSLTIEGPSDPNSRVTIDGVFSRIFEVDGTSTSVTLDHLDLTGGTGFAHNPASAGAADGQGGAIWNGGTLALSDCNLLKNSCRLTLDEPALGGAIYNAGTLKVSNSSLDNNTVGGLDAFGVYGGNGGAIYNAGSLTVINSKLDNNFANGVGSTGGYGGAIFNAYKASASITTGSDLSGNAAETDGGAISNAGTLTLSGSNVSGNSSERGGGIFNDKRGHLAIQSRSSVVNNGPYDIYALGGINISKDSVVGVIVK